MLSGGRGISPANIGTGGRIAPVRGTAAIESSGAAQGLPSFGQQVGTAMFNFLDAKTKLAATEMNMALEQRYSEIWLGKPEEQLQPDGTYKTVFKPGYANSEGMAAVDGYRGYADQLQAVYKEMMDGASSAVQKYFATYATETLSSYLTNGKRHAAASLKKWDEQMFAMEKMQISKGVHDRLVTGDLESIPKFLFDSISQMANRRPMNAAQAEKHKQDILSGMLDFMRVQENPADKIKIIKDMLGGEMSLSTYVHANQLYKGAMEEEYQLRKRAELDLRDAEKARHKEYDDMYYKAILVDDDSINVNRIIADVEAGNLEPKRGVFYKDYLERKQRIEDSEPTLTEWELHNYKKKILAGEMDDFDVNAMEANSSEKKELFNYYRSVQNGEVRADLKYLNDSVASLMKRSSSYRDLSSISSAQQRAEQIYFERLRQDPRVRVDRQAIIEQLASEGYMTQTLADFVKLKPIEFQTEINGQSQISVYMPVTYSDLERVTSEVIEKQRAALEASGKEPSSMTDAEIFNSLPIEVQRTFAIHERRLRDHMEEKGSEALQETLQSGGSFGGTKLDQDLKKIGVSKPNLSTPADKE